MSVQVSVLQSGSSGNACLIASSKTRILIDCGISKKKLFERLRDVGVRASDLDAILITHSHGDHAGQVHSVTANISIPVYLTEATSSAIQWGGRPPQRIHFEPMRPMVIGDIDIFPFPVIHDVPNVGFRFRVEGMSIAFATDLASISSTVAGFLAGAEILFLESNYDEGMLESGPYSQSVKDRVSSNTRGHLSNREAVDFLRREMTTKTNTVILGHVSETSNHPAIVESSAAAAMAEVDLSPRLIVAKQREATATLLY